MSKRNKKRLTRRQQEIRRKRLKKRRRRRRLVIILELIILCILGTRRLAYLSWEKGTHQSFEYKEQRTETDRIYQCCIIWSGFKRKESWKRKPDRYDYDRKHQ